MKRRCDATLMSCEASPGVAKASAGPQGAPWPHTCMHPIESDPDMPELRCKSLGSASVSTWEGADSDSDSGREASETKRMQSDL